MKMFVNDGNENLGLMWNKVPYYTEQRTFCVTGVPRMGTTAIMRLLEAMDIPLEWKNPRNLESPKFSRPFVEFGGGHLGGICGVHDAKWDTWGFKAHDLCKYFEDFFKYAYYLDNSLRNPTFIVPVRDCLSAGIRQKKDTPSENAMSMSFQMNLKLNKVFQFAMMARSPVCFVSYEKLLADTQTTIKLLDWMFGEDRYEFPGMDWLRPGDPRYTEVK